MATQLVMIPNLYMRQEGGKFIVSCTKRVFEQWVTTRKTVKEAKKVHFWAIREEGDYLVFSADTADLVKASTGVVVFSLRAQFRPTGCYRHPSAARKTGLGKHARYRAVAASSRTPFP